MDSHILRTRLLIPEAAADAIQRPRLLEKLNAAASAKLLLVCAPAGTGKTLIASQWLNTRPDQGHVAWLTLAEELDEFHLFAAYLLDALQQSDPAIGQMMPLTLQNPHQLAMIPFTTALINDVAVCGADITLVLDDYHSISNHMIHDAMDRILANAPRNLRLIIISRVDPPLRLSSYRARGQMVELRADDLRFTYAEAAQLLNETHQLELQESALLTLLKRTEGWVTGLQLAALPLAAQPASDRATMVHNLARNNRYIVDYLLEEVFQLQAAPVQAFMLRTSILRRLNPEVCDALAGDSHSAAMLDFLRENNLFVEVLDHDRGVYRYHQLFADLLRHQLRQTAPDLETELHRRASVWYSQHGYEAEALHHALAADDFDMAVQQFERLDRASGLGDDGLFELQFWLQNLPLATLLARPHLRPYHIWALLWSSDFADVVPHLQALRAALCAEADQTHPGHAETLAALIAYYKGDFSAVQREAALALDKLPVTDDRFRLLGEILLGLSYAMQGDAAEAQRIYSRLGWRSQQEKSPDALLFSLALLAHSGLAAGNSAYVERLLMLAERMLDAHTRAELRGLVSMVRGMLLYEQNQIDAAAESLSWGIRQCQNVPLLAAITVDATVTYASLLVHTRQQVTKAHALLENAARRINRQGLVWNLHKLTACQVRLDDAPAPDTRLFDAPDIGNEYRDEYACLTQARVWLAQHETDAALQLLAGVQALADRQGRLTSVLQCLLLEALIWQDQHNPEMAFALLEQALMLAEPMDFVRVFADEGPLMAALLIRFGQARPVNDQPFYKQLLAAFPGQLPAVPGSRPEVGLTEPLTDREAEVLKLLARGLSSLEISTRLTVTRNTTKTHIKNIYSKLNVSCRYEAVEKARALRLISGA